MCIFHFATDWDFPIVRNLCITHIASLVASDSPFDLITLAETHGIDDWLVAAYLSLCLRQTPLSLSEVKEKIDMEHYLAVSALREEVHRSFPQAGSPYPICPDCRIAFGVISCPMCSSNSVPADTHFPDSDREEVEKMVKKAIYMSDPRRSRIPRNKYSREAAETAAYFLSHSFDEAAVGADYFKYLKCKRPADVLYYRQERDGGPAASSGPSGGQGDGGPGGDEGARAGGRL